MDIENRPISRIKQCEDKDKVDVAINIFAKPYQTSLALLSLIRESGAHIDKIWLQYEPAGSKHDKISPYVIVPYLREKTSFKLEISQPQKWLAREPVTRAILEDPVARMGIRYQHAFEQSKSRFLFLMHNDIFVFKDIIGALKEEINDAFACGSIGQCWNCPAANAEIMHEVMGCGACSSDRYQEIKPDHAQLLAIYEKAHEKGIFTRPYDKEGFADDFSAYPWPLPECRVNEWACLLNLEKTQPLSAPFGKALPPGAFGTCGDHNLDIAVPWFREMHKAGLYAINVNVLNYLKHWVGTGKKTPIKYAHAEDNAAMLLRRHFPDFMEWLANNKNPRV